MRPAAKKLLCRWRYRTCFVYKDADYEHLLDQYEILTRNYTGWTLADIRGLSSRERMNWISRAQRTRGK